MHLCKWQACCITLEGSLIKLQAKAMQGSAVPAPFPSALLFVCGWDACGWAA